MKVKELLSKPKQGFKALKSFSIYTLSIVFNQGLGFLLLPIFTHYLTPADYGFLSLTSIAITIFTPFLMVGINGSIRRQYYKLTGHEFSSYTSSSLLIPVIAFLSLALIILLFGEHIGKLMELPKEWLFITLFIGLLGVIPDVTQMLFQVREKPTSFAKFSNGMSVMNMSLGLFMVAVLHLNYQGRIFSILITNAVFTLIGLIIIQKSGFFTSDITKNKIKASFNYGWPSVPHKIGFLVINYSDRLFIAKFVNVQELGIYNIGYTIGSIISIVQSAFIQVYVPYFFKAMKEITEVKKIQIVRITYGFGIVLLVGLVFLRLGAIILFDYFIDPDFSEGIKYVLWIGLGYVFQGMYGMVTNFIYYFEKTRFLSYLAIMNIAFNLFFNYIFISRFGAMGAAYATALSFFVFFVVTFIISYRLFPLPWFSRRILNFREYPAF